MVHVLLRALGTLGDINPFIGIGVAMLRRGHAASLISHAPLEGLARTAGFSVASVDTAERYTRFLGHPDHWHWRRNAQFALREHVLPNVPTVFRRVRESSKPGQTLLVASGMCLGVRIAHDLYGIPLITAQLSPA